MFKMEATKGNTTTQLCEQSSFKTSSASVFKANTSEGRMCAHLLEKIVGFGSHSKSAAASGQVTLVQQTEESHV